MKYKIGQEVMTESEGKGTIEAIDDSQQIPLYFVYFPHLKNSPAKGYKVFNERQLRPYIPKKEIYITVQDDEVQSFLKEDGKVVKKASAKCHPDDDFDFRIGAELAFNRLLEEFKPYIKCLYDGTNLGIIGTETGIKDILNEPLYIGDCVAIIDKAKGTLYNNCEFVCKNFKSSSEFDKNWIIIKTRSYETLKHLEIDGTGYFVAILKEEE